MPKKIAIIGSGPAGIAAAISACSVCGKKASVTLFESSAEVCKTILATGNGRCNFSNVVIDVERFRNSNFVEAFNSFKESDEDVISLLESLGLEWTANEQGLLFPASMKASSVRDVLLRALAFSGANVVTDKTIKTLSNLSDFEAVILATGHRAGRALFEGVDYELQRRVLSPIKTKEDVSLADNVRAKVGLKLVHGNNVVFEEDGEVQFRKYGISGIVTFNASRYARPGDTILLDFTQPVMCENAREHFSERFRRCNKDVDAFFCGFLHDDLALLIKKTLGKKPSFDDLYSAISAFSLTCIEVMDDQKLSQVSRGGIQVDKVSPSTLAVAANKELPFELFACGEVLDVDGPCGGYNLTWCFESGWRAGKSAAASVLP
ncbi:MAG: aminoacetone oxidase family FAD-binding enzyme [Phoenicibacter congonensis]|uniref:Aminoacetone oxidase family FAD-binding enzyme n=1 Tax=Phoenicibacter congonensis TaxID=1944646 RepID=A0AA43UAV6_9ACTN|nr:aminoacetone oxidase family FAD-binding enzyme [Phoenicibacter congonensis]